MAFQQGISGLNAASKNLDVIGHNIANSGTVGFKASRAEFSDLVASSMGASSSRNAGFGVEVSAISQQFSQGGMTMTGNGLDVAINGNGFFKLQMPDGSQAYTRAGNFKLDKTGDVVTNDGAHVMGYKINPASGMADSSVVPLSFPVGAPIPAKQTTSINVSLNLDARANLAAGVPAAPPAAAMPATPRSTYGTSVNAYDSQGVSTPVNIYFEKNGANTWDIYNQLDDLTKLPAVVPSISGRLIANKNGGIAGTLEPIASSVVNADPALTKADDFPTTFTYRFYGPDAAGVNAIREATLTFPPVNDPIAGPWEFTFAPSPPALSADLVTSARLKSDLLDSALGGVLTPTDLLTAPKAANQSYSLSLMVNPSPANPNSPPAIGNPAPEVFPVTLDLNGISQFGNKFAVSDLQQNGYTAGELKNINIGDDGTVMASYSNGVTRAEAQVALTSFRNPQGLVAVGGNNWVMSAESGVPVDGKPGSGSLGSLRAGALEESNVDLTAELVNMMTAQRSYQANAQTIKTQDQIMSTLVNLR